MALIDHWVWILVCPVLAYFIGAIPFSYLIGKWTSGEDIRKSGTKNVGGLNVMVKSGYKWGILAGALDFYKALVCLFVVLFVPFNNNPLVGSGSRILTQHQLIYIFVAMAVILGHNYPVYLKFQGGRGIAAISGFLVLTNPILLLVFVFSMGIAVIITRYMRPSQFIAMFVGVPVAFFLNFFPPWIVNNGLDSTLFLGLFALGISLAILPKYIGPVIGMFKGTEYKIGKEGVEFQEKEETNENAN
jgi:glycerol-3-phosphate acyltransferase PlsY